MTSAPDLRALLNRSRVIAVVGLSPHAYRPSHGVARYLQRHGYRIVPVNPVVAQEGGRILGEICHASLTAAAQALAQEDLTIDVVDCFRRSEEIPPIAQEAIAIGAPCLWMQLGVENAVAAEQARAAGIDVIQDLCIEIEHARLIGRRN